MSHSEGSGDIVWVLYKNKYSELLSCWAISPAPSLLNCYIYIIPVSNTPTPYQLGPLDSYVPVKSRCKYVSLSPKWLSCLSCLQLPKPLHCIIPERQNSICLGPFLWHWWAGGFTPLLSKENQLENTPIPHLSLLVTSQKCGFESHGQKLKLEMVSG